jgi:hypothetical protein
MAREASKRWKLVSDRGDFWLFCHLNMQFLYKNQFLFLLTSADLIGHFFYNRQREAKMFLSIMAHRIFFTNMMRSERLQ